MTTLSATACTAPTALIAEDEPRLASALHRLLLQAWPALTIVAMAGNGAEAVPLALEHTPDMLFLDIRMPGRSGLEVAEAVVDDWPEGRPEPLVVFVTAHDEFAVEAFARSAIDYLLKPVSVQRLAQTVQRLQQRLAERAARPAQGDMAALFQRLQQLTAGAMSPDRAPGTPPLKVLRAAVGNTVRMIALEDVICLQAADKYVNIVTAQGEAVLRISLRELLARIDATDFVQVHRAVMVRSDRILSATRDDAGHTSLRVRGLEPPVKVSRAFSHLFRPM